MIFMMTKSKLIERLEMLLAAVYVMPENGLDFINASSGDPLIKESPNIHLFDGFDALVAARSDLEVRHEPRDDSYYSECRYVMLNGVKVFDLIESEEARKA